MARPPVELPDLPDPRPTPQPAEFPEHDLPETEPPPDEAPDVGPLEIPGDDAG